MFVRPRWLLLGLALVLAWLGTCLWLADQLTRPRRAAPAAPPAMAGVRAEAPTLHTADGLAIAAWALTPDAPPGAVCLDLHALGSCRSRERALFAASRGLAVLSLDLRGHGDSDAARTGFGWHERQELRAAVAWARERWPGLPLVGWGKSLGAATLCYAVDPSLPDALPPGTFSALVLESLHADIDTATRRSIDTLVGAWARPLLAPVQPLGAWLAEVDVGQLSPERALARLRDSGAAPELLLATGALDPLATVDDLRRLAVASGGRAVVVAAAPHADLALQDGGVWLATLRATFDRWGRRGP